MWLAVFLVYNAAVGIVRINLIISFGLDGPRITLTEPVHKVLHVQVGPNPFRLFKKEIFFYQRMVCSALIIGFSGAYETSYTYT